MLKKLISEIFIKNKPVSPIPPADLATDNLYNRHYQALFGEIQFGSLNFLNLFAYCIKNTASACPEWKWYTRPQRALHLAQYYIHTNSIPGEKAECGVFRGFSALMLCHIARNLNNDFSGKGFHLIDSFEGLSEPTPDDAIQTEGDDNSLKFGAPKGKFSTTVDFVQKCLHSFPEIDYHKGWIPDVFHTLNDNKYSFVHLDVDLYEPTLACLEYFYPRVNTGGVIINDDYIAPLFPGAGKAWKEYCEKNQIKYVALDTGQAVIIKT